MYQNPMVQDLSNKINVLSKKIKRLEKYKIFHDHIKAHFEKEHPDWKVICKICGKTFDEIVSLNTSKPKGESDG